MFAGEIIPTPVSHSLTNIFYSAILSIRGVSYSVENKISALASISNKYVILCLLWTLLLPLLHFLTCIWIYILCPITSLIQNFCSTISIVSFPPLLHFLTNIWVYILFYNFCNTGRLFIYINSLISTQVSTLKICCLIYNIKIISIPSQM